MNNYIGEAKVHWVGDDCCHERKKCVSLSAAECLQERNPFAFGACRCLHCHSGEAWNQLKQDMTEAKKRFVDETDQTS